MPANDPLVTCEVRIFSAPGASTKVILSFTMSAPRRVARSASTRRGPLTLLPSVTVAAPLSFRSTDTSTYSDSLSITASRESRSALFGLEPPVVLSWKLMLASSSVRTFTSPSCCLACVISPSRYPLISCDVWLKLSAICLVCSSATVRAARSEGMLETS